MTPPPPLIGFEIHDASLWDPDRVLPLLPTLQRWGYNALVLHQNDLLDEATQLGLTANYGLSDLRLKKTRNAAAWLGQLSARLADQGAKLLLEIKEPSFHDYAAEFYPDLLGSDGLPDPANPAWAAFCKAKVEDLLARAPGIGGLIITLSSPESRVSLPDFLATRGPLDTVDWFERMIAAFHTPLRAAGKVLYIRDFSYTADMTSDVLRAVARFGGAVGSSVKITAHDYFPDYPQNPAAEIAPDPMLFEFDGFGEHMGWGVIPNCRVGEFRRRMQGYRARGAAGLLARSSWEAIKGANALDGLSAMNIYALPRLAAQDVEEDALILEWLQDTHGVKGTAAQSFAELLLTSWQVPAAAYWNGSVFPRHSCLPSSWQEGWLSMQSDGMGRRDRDLNIAVDDPKLTDAALANLFASKDQAVVVAKSLSAAAKALEQFVPAPLLAPFDWLVPYAQMFAHATRATAFAARRETGPMLDRETDALLRLADRLAFRLSATESLPAHHHVLFDPQHIRDFVQSL